MAVFALLVALFMGGGAAASSPAPADGTTVSLPGDVGGMPGGH